MIPFIDTDLIADVKISGLFMHVKHGIPQGKKINRYENRIN